MESRAHDNVYDPVYTTSASLSFGRQAARSSQLRSHARGGGGGRSSAASAAMTREVRGRDMVKFVKRPVLPGIGASSNIHYDRAVVTAEGRRFAADVNDDDDDDLGTDDDDDEDGYYEDGERNGPPRMVTVAVQTQYRESGAQTDPYTPAIKPLPPDAPKPEVLGLAHLKFGRGLPASLEEVKQVKRLRDKRAFEASLPPVTDEKSFQLRQQLLEQQELKEWSRREAEMREEQEQRLDLLVEKLRAREAKYKQYLDRRVDQVRQQKTREKNRALASIQRRRVKTYRALGRRQLALEQKKGKKRDLVQEYSDYSSKVYAPAALEGKVSGQTAVVEYGIPSTQSLGKFNELEETRDVRRAATLTVRSPKTPSPRSRDAATTTTAGKGLTHRQQDRLNKDLEFLDTLVRTAKEAPREQGPVTKNIYKQFEAIARPPTPRVQVDEEKRARDRAASLLQALLRGRATQTDMLQGRSQYAGVIQEVQTEAPRRKVQLSQRHVVAVTAIDALIGSVLSSLHSRGEQQPPKPRGGGGGGEEEEENDN